MSRKDNRFVYIFREAKPHGSLILRPGPDELNFMDIFPNRRKARQDVKNFKKNRETVSILGIKTNRIPKSLPFFSVYLDLDALQFLNYWFPLSERGLKALSGSEAKMPNPWLDMFEKHGQEMLWLMTSVWFQEYTKHRAVDFSKADMSLLENKELLDRYRHLKQQLVSQKKREETRQADFEEQIKRLTEQVEQAKAQGPDSESVEDESVEDLVAEISALLGPGGETNS